ncbi:MAG: PIN domain-containing protein [Verrucomicrobia bacterium]|nr:PIN domain-containing protein [Verrucomicrobiota bacterium]
MKTVLLDTGPIIASLDASDPAHSLARDGFHRLTGKIITTGAVLTEAMFFLQELPSGPSRLVDWIDKIRAEVVDCFQPNLLKTAAELMTQYKDIPMDFADATLVILATRFDCADILTLDERGFRTFRHRGKKPFKLLLQTPHL